MKKVEFKDINCDLYLYGFATEEELVAEIEKAIKWERIKTWFELAFRVKPKAKQEIEIFNVKSGLSKADFGIEMRAERQGDYEDIVWNSEIEEILNNCKNKPIYGQQGTWCIGVIESKVVDDNSISKIRNLAAIILHELMHISQKEEYPNGIKLMDFAKSDDAEQLYLPTKLKIEGCKTEYVTILTKSQEESREWELLPYFIEAETLAFLQTGSSISGEINCKNVLYNPDEVYEKACEDLNRKR